MITSFILNIPAQLLSAFIGFLPIGQGIPSSWIDAVYSLWGYVNAFSFIVPVGILISCVSIAIAVEIAILGFKLFNWVITKIPFIG